MKNGWADFFTSNRNEHELIKWNSLNEIYPKINGTPLPPLPGQLGSDFLKEKRQFQNLCQTLKSEYAIFKNLDISQWPYFKR